VDGRPEDGNSPLWAVDNLFHFTDRHRGSQAQAFPPTYNEAPPDRSFISHRQRMAKFDRRCEKEAEESLDDALQVDFTGLSRPERIRLLESLVGGHQAEELPAHRRNEELQPVREVLTARCRREFRSRWGMELSPRELTRRGRPDESVDSEGSSELPGEVYFRPPGFVYQPKAPPTIQAEDTGSPKWKVKSVPLPRRLPGVLPRARKHRLSDDEESENLASKDTAALLEELGKYSKRTSSSTAAEAMQEAAQMTVLARALEVRAYKLRSDHLLEAMVLVGQGAGLLEAAAKPTKGQPLAAKEGIRRAAEEMQASTHALATAAAAQALTADVGQVANALKAIADSGSGCQEYLDAQLARLQELLRGQLRTTAPLLAKIAGALGSLFLAGAEGKPGLNARDGATPGRRAANQRFVKDFTAMLMEKLADFLEDDFHQLGWVFPTTYLGEHELRRLLTRAAELQVGLRPESERTKEAIRHILGFITAKMPTLTATLNDFVRRYCEKLAGGALARY